MCLRQLRQICKKQKFFHSLVDRVSCSVNSWSHSVEPVSAGLYFTLKSTICYDEADSKRVLCAIMSVSAVSSKPYRWKSFVSFVISTQHEDVCVVFHRYCNLNISWKMNLTKKSRTHSPLLLLDINSVWYHMVEVISDVVFVFSCSPFLSSVNRFSMALRLAVITSTQSMQFAGKKNKTLSSQIEVYVFFRVFFCLKHLVFWPFLTYNNKTFCTWKSVGSLCIFFGVSFPETVALFFFTWACKRHHAYKTCSCLIYRVVMFTSRGKVH